MKWEEKKPIAELHERHMRLKKYWGITFQLLISSIVCIFNFLIFTRKFCNRILSSMNGDKISPVHSMLRTKWGDGVVICRIRISRACAVIVGKSFQDIVCTRTVIRITFPSNFYMNMAKNYATINKNHWSPEFIYFQIIAAFVLFIKHLTNVYDLSI